MILRIATVISVSLLFAYGAHAQIADAPADPFRKYGETVAVKYRVGARIEASRGAVRDIVAMVAVPWECDEQEVIVSSEDISPEIDAVEYRTIDGGARQMVITIPHLPSGTEAHAILNFEVRTKTILPPDEALTAELIRPKKPDRELKRYLGRSPFIQAKDSKIRRTLKEIFNPKKEDTPQELDEDSVELTTFDEEDELADGIPEADASGSPDTPEADASGSPDMPEANASGSPDAPETDASGSPDSKPAELTAWQRVEKIYDFVQGHVKYLEGEDQSAVETLDRKQGDCHDISALFVALCRADKIPARMVWVHEHQYPEFCLEDAEGQRHWFPCESAGMRAFGEMPTARVIMQKGDNFRVPERPREPLRYASDYLIGLPVGNSGKPKATFIREML